MSNCSPGSQTIAFDAERLDAERAVQLLPAAVLGRLDGVLCEIDLGHDSPCFGGQRRAPDDDSPAHREPLHPQLADAGVAPPVRAPDRADAAARSPRCWAQEAAGAIPASPATSPPAGGRSVSMPTRRGTRHPAARRTPARRPCRPAAPRVPARAPPPRIVDIAQQVGVDERVHRAVVERQRLRLALDELDPLVQARRPAPFPAALEHRRVLVDADHPALVAACDLDRDRGRAGGDVSHQRRPWATSSRRPAGRASAVVAEREQLRPAVVVAGDAVEQFEGVALSRESVIPPRTGRAQRPPAGRRARSSRCRCDRARGGR